MTRKLKSKEWHTKYASPTYTKYLELFIFYVLRRNLRADC